MLLNANKLDYKVLNENLRKTHEHCTITDCCGQRFIAAGMSDKEITIDGVPGNALGAYLNGATITVNTNARRKFLRRVSGRWRYRGSWS